MSKPCVSTLRRRILPRLVDAEAVYSSGRSPEELNLLADIFAEDLEGENPESIDQAFRLHRRESTRFPTPAHILALLPRCRAVNDTLAIPEAQIKCTPGYGKMVCDAVRGDPEAKLKMDALIAQTLSGG